MRNSIHHHKHNSHVKKYNKILNAIPRSVIRTKLKRNLNQMKALNKGLTHYVEKRPYRAIGIAALFVGAVVGLLYTGYRNFKD